MSRVEAAGAGAIAYPSHHILRVPNQEERATGPPEPARPPYAVQESFWVGCFVFFRRHVELDDERNRRHVDAPREHVGRDEEARGARAKIFQHLQGVPLCVAGCAAGVPRGAGKNACGCAGL